MTADLRPYQHEVIADFDRAVEAGEKKVILVAPTGSGKTIIAGAIVHSAVSREEQVLFLAHRREILQQTSAKLHDCGLDHGIIQAGFPTRPGEAIQVASIQTLHARAIRGSAMELPRADLVIVDEAHHCRAETYQKILAKYPEAVILGLTATPCRGDGRGLGNVFSYMIECPPVARLIELGFLVGTRVYAPTTPDLKGVKVQAGDYVESQLAERMDTPKLVGDIVTHWHRLAGGLRSVVFATSVAHSVHLRDEFIKSGVRAEHIDGKTPKEERDAILARLRSGETEVVCNCMVLTEGWDMPEVSCVVLARPTKHTGLFRQMIGRVLRPAQGKPDALVLDHAGAVFQHGFVEEAVGWTLDADKRAKNATHEARAHGGPASRICKCPKCDALRIGGEACPMCGWKPTPKPRSVDVADGELGRLDRNGNTRHQYASPEIRVQWHRQLLWIARDRGYKDGWAAHKYKEKFGSWPANRTVAPEAPSGEIKSWVRSRQIAYAKAIQKAETETSGASA